MNFKRISIAAIPAIGLGLMPAAAFAQITQDTTFTGSVPGNCSYTTAAQDSVALSYDSASSGTLSGESNNIGIQCNFANTNVQLGAVEAAGANPATTTNTARLLDSEGEEIAVSGEGPSGSEALSNSANATENVTIELTSTGASAPGSYSYTVTLTTLES